ncbi:hypothetical protein H4Q26_017133 [Puccinia striiformis f. sp. tritici PST-130]|nr:hypothetical protein H4Q26_017133 [Puccinia striiformis f. sp. tritici PST-130]
MLLVLTIIALIAFPSGLLASSIQVCTSYYIPSVTLNPGDIYCQTADDKNFKCPSNSCGVAEDHYFLNCARFLAKGKTTPYKYTVHYTKFIATMQGDISMPPVSAAKYSGALRALHTLTTRSGHDVPAVILA